MDLMAEAALLFGLCLLGECISALLPFSFPASVAALLLLLTLLLSGVVKPRHLQCFSEFFTAHMGLFFVPAAVSIIEYLDLLKANLLPFVFIAVVTTPIVYGATAWSVQLLMGLEERGGKKDG